ncbi:MAG: 4Fe-4S binding protein [Bacteroidales bacterium]|nr:4Fe-4S binding protein [Bacteroidales bacterium]
MEIQKVNLIYFSATNTTKQVLLAIAKGVGCNAIQAYDITLGQEGEIEFEEDELVIFGFPVYAGRIPQLSVPVLNQFKGKNTPAIIVCVYGNRDYDDALLELRNLVSANQFMILSAGVFIGQHSIFPKTGANRPDQSDLSKAQHFGEESMMKLKEQMDLSDLPEIKVKGNFPYKEANPIPLIPSGNRKCTVCGKCVRNCPTQAISLDNPRKTDKTRCISCGRCIYVCPENSRQFRGVLYSMAEQKFNRTYAERKEPELFYSF